MSEIIINNNDGLLTVNSYRVAKDFGKIHRNIVRDIENLMKKSHCSNLSSENIH